MTIAAGFHCKDGVLLCADTEHSAYALSFHENKIFKIETAQLKALFSFTGSMHLAHAAIQKCIHKLKVAKLGTIKTHYDVALIVEQIVNAEYRKHVTATPDHNTEPAYQLLLAAWCDASEGAAIYSTWHGVIEQAPRYACVGAGLVVGHYLLGPVFTTGMDLDNARILAICTVSAAKEHVDGVGGKTNLLSISHSGVVTPHEWLDVQPVERVLKTYDINVRYLLFDLLSMEDAHFDSKFEFIGNLFRQMRRTLRIDDQSQVQRTAANERLIAALTSLAERSAQQSTTHAPQPPPASQE